MFETKEALKEALKPIVEAYKADRNETERDGRNTGNTTPAMVVEAQKIFAFITYDKSDLFPDNPSKDWDAESYGSFLTCDTCYNTIMKYLRTWYESN